MKNQMKTKKGNLRKGVRCLTLIVLLLTLNACSKDDSDSSSSVSVNVPDGVPSGTIVAENQRFEVLTGFTEGTSGRNANQQLKWAYDYGKVLSNSCPEYEQSLSGNYYLSFQPSGTISYSNDEGSFVAQSREWEFNSDKTAMIIEGVEFFFAELNDNRVVYFSEQSSSECDIVSFEVMHEPTVE